MYEELIKRLREIHPEEFGDAWDFAFACQQTMREAADAIEELSKLEDNGEATYEIMVRQTSYIEKLKQKIPNWIPVTETLPKKERKKYWVCTDTGYQCECRWTNNRFGIGESNEWGWSIADVPQYHKVVAWMFLPEPYEPPKEDENNAE